MRKKQAICAVLVLASTSFAYGAQLRSFTPVGVENANAEGMGILQYRPWRADTALLLAVTNFTPSTRYDVELVNANGSAVALDVLVTDQYGNACYKANFPSNFENADILIYVSDDPVLTEDELRAVGTPFTLPDLHH